MSGHAILDSCHNCGAKNVELRIVSACKTSDECGHVDDDATEPRHHIHVVAACNSCREQIWDKQSELTAAKVAS